ncbi:FAD-binding protein [Actinomadura rugatobispora]|uniref:FAD-binding protein n=1 Tax=Actinomadura rugatobispora TaxID=1994 RepID=A0ABW1A039_9ACTN
MALGDFGDMVRRTPVEVVRPASAREVADVMLRHGPARPLSGDGHGPSPGGRQGAQAVVPRGCGHSTDGSSLTGGVSLDMRALAAIGEVRGDRVRVEAGATWREVLDAALPHGLTPPVLTDLLDLTVGGTLSAGGVGGASHVHGPQTANVIDLEVVTREGAVVRCSASENRTLFGAVRGGMGRHGVITAATLRLVPAPRRVLACTVPCRDAAGLLAVQTRTRADHISGQARPSEGGGWRFEAKAVLYDADEPPPGLECTEAEALPYPGFADRMRPDVQELIVLGEWARPHPWAMAFLPGAAAARLIEDTLAAMGPADLGLSGIVLVKALTGIDGVPDPVLFGLLRTASPGCASTEEMIEANRVFLARARAAGGRPYPEDGRPTAPRDGQAAATG